MNQIVQTVNGDSGWKKTNELILLIQFVWFHHASHSFSEWKWLHEMNSSGLWAAWLMALRVIQLNAIIGMKVWFDWNTAAPLPFTIEF